MLGEPLFCLGVGIGLMPLGQFLLNVAVGLLASVRVLYARNLYLGDARLGDPLASPALLSLSRETLSRP